MLLLSALSGAVALAGCQDATGPHASNVSALAMPAGISVSNGTPVPIFYMASETGTLALLNWIPCYDASRCTTIAPGTTSIIPWSEIVGADAARYEYRLFWWTADADGPHGALTVNR